MSRLGSASAILTAFSFATFGNDVIAGSGWCMVSGTTGEEFGDCESGTCCCCIHLASGGVPSSFIILSILRRHPAIQFSYEENSFLTFVVMIMPYGSAPFSNEEF